MTGPMPRAPSHPSDPIVPLPDARVLAVEPLTGHAAEIAEAIGPDAAVRLMALAGGGEVSIPVWPEGSALARLVGEDVLALMLRAFGPGKMIVPAGPFRGVRGRRARGLCLLMDGASVAAVARACDVHAETVKGWRRTLRRRGLLPPTPTLDPNPESTPR